MKKSLFVAAIAALSIVACKKTEVAVDATTEDTTVVVADSMNTPVMEDSTTIKTGDSSTVVVETPAATTVEVAPAAPATTEAAPAKK